MTPGSRLELESVDASVDRRRFYSMQVVPDPQIPLFPGELPDALLLVLRWGRLGTRGRTLRKRFASPEDLARAWRATLAERRRHGYRTTREELPDGSWTRRGA